MKEFKVTDGKSEYALNLPTSLSEITPDYLTMVTNNVTIAPYYAVIGTVYRCKLPEVIASNKKSKAMAVAIIPVFVKANFNGKFEDGTKKLLEGFKPGDRIIIAGSDIERGYGLSTPSNFITIDNIVKIYNHDNGFAKSVMADQNYYYFVDFKMVPVTDIKGKYEVTNPNDYINPFAKVVGKENAN